MQNPQKFIHAVDEVVKPLVKQDSDNEYVFYRTKLGCWKCVQLIQGEDIPDNITSDDPCAVKFTGNHLFSSSYATHEFLLTARLHREMRQTEWADLREAESVVYFMDDYVRKLSPEEMDCLANHEAPVKLLSDTIPVSLKLEGYAYNKENASDAFTALLHKLKAAKGA